MIWSTGATRCVPRSHTLCVRRCSSAHRCTEYTLYTKRVLLYGARRPFLYPTRGDVGARAVHCGTDAWV